MSHKLTQILRVTSIASISITASFEIACIFLLLFRTECALYTMEDAISKKEMANTVYAAWNVCMGSTIREISRCGRGVVVEWFSWVASCVFPPFGKKCAQWARTTVYKNASAYYVLYGTRTYFFDTKILICKKIWNQRSSTFRRSWKYGTTNVPSSREISRFGTFFPVFASIPASGFLFSFRTSESHAVQSVPHRRKVESTSNCTL